jgi:hypothetical protein
MRRGAAYVASPSLSFCTFAELRERAFELGASGRYRDWKQVAAAMEKQSWRGAKARLAKDAILQRIIDAHCEAARRSNWSARILERRLRAPTSPKQFAPLWRRAGQP